SVHPEAKQSPDFASLHPGYDSVHAARWNVTPHRSNESPDIAQPFAFAASSTLATLPTLNVSPLMMSLSPLTKTKLPLGSFSSGSPLAFLETGISMIRPQCSASSSGSGLCISTPVNACVTSLRIDFCQS